MKELSLVSRNYKVLFLSLTFICVPIILFLVLSGDLFEHTIWWAVVFTGIIVAGVLLFIKSKANRIYMVFAFVSIAIVLIVSVSKYTLEMNNVSALGKDLGEIRHSFSGYVQRQDAKAGENMYISIRSVDGQLLKREVMAYGRNYSGHHLERGSYIEFSGIFNELGKEGKNQMTNWLKSRGVYCSIEGISDILTDFYRDEKSVVLSFKNKINNALAESLYFIPHKEDYERAVFLSRGVLFGDKSAFESDIMECFKKSGITHLLCVSGLHFSIMLSSLKLILRKFIRNKRIVALVLIVVAIFYLSMCGFTKSAVRAGIMALLAATGIKSQRKHSGVLGILMAVWIICTFDVNSVYDTGFHMSVLACAGIICSQHFADKVQTNMTGHKVIAYIFEVVFMSLGVFSFVSLYTLFCFGGASTVSVLATAAAIIPAQIYLILCWSSSFLGIMGIRCFDMLISAILSFVSNIIYEVARFFSELKFSYVTAELPGFEIIYFFVILLLLGYCWASRFRCACLHFIMVSLSVFSVCGILLMNMV